MSVVAGNSFTAELVIKPVPSCGLFVFILFLHLLVTVVLFALPGLPLWVAFVLMFAVFGSLVYSLLLHSDRLPDKSVETLYWRESGGWELTTSGGDHLPVIFCSSSFSSVFIDVLNFKTRDALGKRRFTVILLPDNSDAAQRRHLRMRLLLLRVVN